MQKEYEYYRKEKSKKHFFFSREITKIYGIVSDCSKKLHYTLVSGILKKYCNQNNEEELFYATRNGMVQVFKPEAEIFLLEELLKGKGQVIIDSKRYKYMYSSYQERMWKNAIEEARKRTEAS